MASFLLPTSALGGRETAAAAADVDCDANIGPNGLAAIWTMVVFALAVVATRFYVQLRLTKQTGLSDYLMAGSMAVIVGFAALISVQFRYGWGRHQACITAPGELTTQLKFNLTGQSFGIMGSTLGRMSFIVFMVALFGSRRWVRRVLWALFAAQLATNLGTVVVIYSQCRDPRALYDHVTPWPAGTCWPSYVQTYLGWAHTAFNGACDAFLAILPTYMVWNLHMATRLKIGLAMLLGMSILALVGLIMKCVYLGALSNLGDYSYNTVPMFTWITVEGTLVAIAASVPLLRPLFRKDFASSRSKKSSGQASYDLPRYYPHPRTDSSGFSRIKSGGGGGGGANNNTTTTTTAAMRDDSDEDPMLLVLQRAGGEQQDRIVVRHEYAVDYAHRSPVRLAHEDKKMKGEPAGEAQHPQPPSPVWKREEML